MDPVIPPSQIQQPQIQQPQIQQPQIQQPQIQQPQIQQPQIQQPQIQQSQIQQILQSQITDPQVSDQTTPERNNQPISPNPKCLPNMHQLSRSNSRSRGINLNTVSPSPRLRTPILTQDRFSPLRSRPVICSEEPLLERKETTAGSNSIATTSTTIDTPTIETPATDTTTTDTTTSDTPNINTTINTTIDTCTGTNISSTSTGMSTSNTSDDTSTKTITDTVTSTKISTDTSDQASGDTTYARDKKPPTDGKYPKMSESYLRDPLNASNLPLASLVSPQALNSISKLDMDSQLRLLALKEMSVVELKDNIAKLNAQLLQDEQDLVTLRHSIQHSLYQKIKTDARKRHKQVVSKEPDIARLPKKETSQQLESATLAGGLSTATTATSTSHSLNATDVPEDSLFPALSAVAKTVTGDRLSTLWSNISKPITFIQLLDAMILNEIESSLRAEYDPVIRAKPVLKPLHAVESLKKTRKLAKETQRKQHVKESDTQDFSKASNAECANETTNKNIVNNQTNAVNTHTNTVNTHTNTVNTHTKFVNNQTNVVNNPTNVVNNQTNADSADPDFMFQTVSKSLWTFVNEMKQNMIDTLNETTPAKSPNRDSLSAIDTEVECLDELNS